MIQPAFLKQVSYTYMDDDILMKADNTNWNQQMIKHMDNIGLPNKVTEMIQHGIKTGWIPESLYEGSPFDYTNEYGTSKLLPELTVLGTFIDKQSGVSDSEYSWLYPVAGIKHTVSYNNAESKMINALIDLNLGHIKWNLPKFYNSSLEGKHPVYTKRRDTDEWELIWVDTSRGDWEKVLGGETLYWSKNDNDYIADLRDLKMTSINIQEQVPYSIMWYQELALGTTFRSQLSELMFAGTGTHVYDINKREYIHIYDIDNYI